MLTMRRAIRANVQRAGFGWQARHFSAFFYVPNEGGMKDFSGAAKVVVEFARRRREQSSGAAFEVLPNASTVLVTGAKLRRTSLEQIAVYAKMKSKKKRMARIRCAGETRLFFLPFIQFTQLPSRLPREQRQRQDASLAQRCESEARPAHFFASRRCQGFSCCAFIYVCSRHVVRRCSRR